ncbi:DUF2071 domain-containing protein [Longimicrobium sp.]|uniref:YqjF family protein n=1 Tax=Longimicrobium sp. TaxID=2029185 RepID=UPI002D05DBCB|nr:DUF2071 domain-containing protein [Longimicrobium sp.]HSU14518.1 DUF2071 domain-containing protein [Longimicrobium sp.]
MTDPQPAPATGGRFLTAAWRTLVMLNWEVDPGILRPFVPRGTELDAWQGKTFVSAVGFLFLGTRVLGIPVPFHRDFEEVNLRFYVGRQGPEGWRRGVCFVREIVPRWAIATLARAVYNERYVALPMRHRVEISADAGEAEYAWALGGRWNTLRARFAGSPAPLVPGSEEEFITEHYWGYTAQRDGGTVEYRVEHPSWRVWTASEAALDADVAALYGVEFSQALSQPPSSAFVADGSPIVVRRPRRVA